MNKSKALALVFGVVMFLSVMSVGIPKLNYYFVSPAKVAQNTNCLVNAGCLASIHPAQPGDNYLSHFYGQPVKPGTNGLAQYFNDLVKSGKLALAPL